MDTRESTATSDSTPNSTPFVPDEKKLNAHPALRARLEAVRDPLSRYRQASEIASRCYYKNPEMATLRQRRRKPIVALFRFHGVNKAKIAREIGSDRRTVDSAFAKVDLRQIPKIFEENKEAALEAARKLHAEYVDRENQGITAREMRRGLIHALKDGEFGERFKGDELALMAGNSAARISQQLTGSSNKARLKRMREETARKRLEGGGGTRKPRRGEAGVAA